MATGGVFSRSVEGASDQDFDYKCTTCEKHNNNVEAVHYCVDCDQYYCPVCIKVHGGIPALENHNLLGRNKLKSWGKPKRSASMPTEICSQHSGKTVEMFCGNHDLVGCHVCISLKHRTCKDMHFIPEVAKGITQSQDFMRVNKNIERVKTDIEQMKNTRQQKKATLGKSRKDVLQSIKDFRQQVNRIFDTLEKKVTDDLEKLNRDNDKDLQDDIDACDNFMTKLKLLKQQLDTSSAANESQTFINVKKCQKQLTDGDQLIQTMLATPRNDSIHFISDQKLQSFLASIEYLGKLEMRSTVPEIKKQKDQPYKVDHGREYNVRIKEDKRGCYISGSCLMPNGAILLTDNTNNKLKRLGTTYKVTDHCDLPAGPLAVCSTGQQEVAVTDMNRTIHFVSVGSKMKITRSIQMNHCLSGIAYNNDQLYVSDEGNQVYIYNTSGTCLRTLYTDNNGVEMFSSTYHIAVSPDGTKIYVADERKGLVTLDSSGQLLSKFSDKQLSCVRAVGVDNDGSVLVCGWASNNVMQMDEGGKQKIGELATRIDGIYHPVSVCIDKLNSTMMVTMWRAGGLDTVCVFDLK